MKLSTTIVIAALIGLVVGLFTGLHWFFCFLLSNIIVWGVIEIIKNLSANKTVIAHKIALILFGRIKEDDGNLQLAPVPQELDGKVICRLARTPGDEERNRTWIPEHKALG